jgi:hypothetical protein
MFFSGYFQHARCLLMRYVSEKNIFFANFVQMLRAEAKMTSKAVRNEKSHKQARSLIIFFFHLNKLSSKSGNLF